MVVNYGMSEKVGNLSFYKMALNSYEKPYSDVTAQLIDDEVRIISDTQFQRAVDLLKEKREQLDQLAALLLEKEVLQKSDLVQLLGKRQWDTEEIEETAALAESIQNERPEEIAVPADNDDIQDKPSVIE
jgi:cell division protease FtsH